MEVARRNRGPPISSSETESDGQVSNHVASPEADVLRGRSSWCVTIGVARADAGIMLAIMADGRKCWMWLDGELCPQEARLQATSPAGGHASFLSIAPILRCSRRPVRGRGRHGAI